MSIFSVLAEKLEMSQGELLHEALRAPNTYKVYSIPKRTFGRRVIAQPKKIVKTLQRQTLDLLEFPIHHCALAYQKDLSIKDNAQYHRYNQYLLKMDLSNFFNSITPTIFWNEWSALSLDEVDLHTKTILNHIFFWNNGSQYCLSVGAPSSPALSNFCMYRFDCELSSICINRGVVYTRYADDMTLSTNKKNELFDFPDIIKKLLLKYFGNHIILNSGKTVFSSKAHNRHVTGVTISNTDDLSIGRDKKRYIKHLVHQFMLGNLSEQDINHLSGYLSYIKHIEPKFINSLMIKYSRDIIESLIKRKVIK